MGIRSSCMPSGSVPERAWGAPLPLFPGCAGNAGLCPACGSCPGRSGETSPLNKKAMGLLCSMALIGFGIYLAAMRAAPAGPSWAGKSPRSGPLPGCAENVGLCPTCGSFPGRSGETSHTQQKSHGAFMLHGFDWFGDLWGGDAGGCGQLLLSLLGLGRALAPSSCRAVRRIPARTRLQVMPGCSGETSPTQQKSHGAFMLHGFD